MEIRSKKTKRNSLSEGRDSMEKKEWRTEEKRA
jgi:hypothetical protein